MNFSAQIDRMEEAGLLYQVIVDFCSDKADMGPERSAPWTWAISFENLVQRFSESYNEEAGAHFTSRDIIYLMCDLLVTGIRTPSRGGHHQDGLRHDHGHQPDAHLHGGAAEATGRRRGCYLFRPGAEPIHLRHRQGGHADPWG